jgi:sulfite dehydrogenase
LKGIAFDEGAGIQKVLFSDDGGREWRETTLGKDLGRYSFREWSTSFAPAKAGKYDLKVKAISRTGESQPPEPRWNPAGYMRNVIETMRVEVV